jgi:hypothetical protein
MTDHGSNKRQRRKVLSARFNDNEAAAVKALADKRGQSVGTLLRSTLLGIPAPARSVRKPGVEMRAVSQMLAAAASLTGAVNRIGTNINQIAKEDNMGRDLRLNSLIEEWREFKEMFDRDQNEYRTVLMRAAGLEPNRKITD